MDYNTYTFSIKELFIYGIQGIIGCMVIGYLFYNSYIAVIIMLPLLILFYKVKKSDLAGRERHKLNLQFRDGILSVSASLQAGYSMENGFEQALEELSKLYDKKQPIINEFQKIVMQLKLNVTLEELLGDLAKRSGVEDIESFAEIFTIAKRTGGDFIKIIQKSTSNLSEKIETQEEVELSIAGKQMEQKIMSMVPFGIIIYVRLTSPEFLSVLYGNVLGITVMTVCLLIYGFAYWSGKKIVDIEI